MPGAGTLSYFPASPFPCACPASTPGLRTAALRVRCSAAATAVRVRGPTRSPYEVLCIEVGASAVQIKAAYRALAKRLHPDAARTASEADFIEVRDAYFTLSDPDARARYDRTAVPPRYSAPAVFRGRRWETDQCW